MAWRAGQPMTVDFANAPSMIGADAIGTFPLPPGRYVVRLLPDDGLRDVAESQVFTITN